MTSLACSCSGRARRIRIRSGCAFAALLTLMAAVARAEESPTAPAALHGNSFVLSWGEDRIQRHVGEPGFRPVRGNQTLNIYVSSAGRVFSRLNFATRAGTGSANRVQGDISNNPLFRQWLPAFGDRSMSTSQNFQKGGKRLIEIEYDGALTSCKARVTYVPEDKDKTSFGWSPITKKMVEFQSIAMSGESCAVRKGNVFQGG